MAKKKKTPYLGRTGAEKATQKAYAGAGVGRDAAKSTKQYDAGVVESTGSTGTVFTPGAPGGTTSAPTPTRERPSRTRITPSGPAGPTSTYERISKENDKLLTKSKSVKPDYYGDTDTGRTFEKAPKSPEEQREADAKRFIEISQMRIAAATSKPATQKIPLMVHGEPVLKNPVAVKTNKKIFDAFNESVTKYQKRNAALLEADKAGTRHGGTELHTVQKVLRLNNEFVDKWYKHEDKKILVPTVDPDIIKGKTKKAEEKAQKIRTGHMKMPEAYKKVHDRTLEQAVGEGISEIAGPISDAINSPAGKFIRKSVNDAKHRALPGSEAVDQINTAGPDISVKDTLGATMKALSFPLKLQLSTDAQLLGHFGVMSKEDVAKYKTPVDLLTNQGTGKKETFGGEDFSQEVFNTKKAGIVFDFVFDPLMYVGVGEIKSGLKGATEAAQLATRLEKAGVGFDAARLARMRTEAADARDFKPLNTELRDIADRNKLDVSDLGKTADDKVVAREVSGKVGVIRRAEEMKSKLPGVKGNERLLAEADRIRDGGAAGRLTKNKETMARVEAEQAQREAAGHGVDIGLGPTARTTYAPSSFTSESVIEAGRWAMRNRTDPGFGLNLMTPLGNKIAQPLKLRYDRGVGKLLGKIPTGSRVGNGTGHLDVAADSRADTFLRLQEDEAARKVGADLFDELATAQKNIKDIEKMLPSPEKEKLLAAAKETQKTILSYRERTIGTTAAKDRKYLGASLIHRNELKNKQRFAHSIYMQSLNDERRFHAQYMHLVKAAIKPLKDDAEGLGRVVIWMSTKNGAPGAVNKLPPLSEAENLVRKNLNSVTAQLGDTGATTRTLMRLVKEGDWMPRQFHPERAGPFNENTSELINSTPSLGEGGAQASRDEYEMASMMEGHTFGSTIKMLWPDLGVDESRKIAEQIYEAGRIRAVTDVTARMLSRGKVLRVDDMVGKDAKGKLLPEDKLPEGLDINSVDDLGDVLSPAQMRAYHWDEYQGGRFFKNLEASEGFLQLDTNADKFIKNLGAYENAPTTRAIREKLLANEQDLSRIETLARDTEGVDDDLAESYRAVHAQLEAENAELKALENVGDPRQLTDEAVEKMADVKNVTPEAPAETFQIGDEVIHKGELRSVHKIGEKDGEPALFIKASGSNRGGKLVPISEVEKKSGGVTKATFQPKADELPLDHGYTIQPVDDAESAFNLESSHYNLFPKGSDEAAASHVPVGETEEAAQKLANELDVEVIAISDKGGRGMVGGSAHPHRYEFKSPDGRFSEESYPTEAAAREAAIEYEQALRARDVPADLTEALISWKKWPSDMRIHMKNDREGIPALENGTSKQRRAQAAALRKELAAKGRANDVPLYRGSNARGGGVQAWTEDRKVAEDWAQKNNGEVHELAVGEGKGIRVKDYLEGESSTGAEAEWLIDTPTEQWVAMFKPEHSDGVPQQFPAPTREAAIARLRERLHSKWEQERNNLPQTPSPEFSQSITDFRETHGGILPDLNPAELLEWSVRSAGRKIAEAARIRAIHEAYGRNMADTVDKITVKASGVEMDASEFQPYYKSDSETPHIQDGWKKRGTDKIYSMDEVQLHDRALVPVMIHTTDTGERIPVRWVDKNGREWQRADTYVGYTESKFTEGDAGTRKALFDQVMAPHGGAVWPVDIMRDFGYEYARMGQFDSHIIQSGKMAAFNTTMANMRAGVTTFFPAFHTRNMVSDLLMSLQNDSGVLFHPIFNVKVMMLMLKRDAKWTGGLADKIKGVGYINVPGWGRMKNEEYLLMLDVFHGRSTNMQTADLGLTGSRDAAEIAKSNRITPKFSKNPVAATGRFFNPAAKGGFMGLGRTGKAGHVAQELSSRREDIARAMTFGQAMRRNGGDVADATWHMIQTHFDYGDLTMWERRTMRNLFLFYTWYRKNIPRQLYMIVHRPGFFNAINSFNQALLEGNTPFNQDWSHVWNKLPNTEGPAPVNINQIPEYVWEQNPFAIKWNDHAMVLPFGAPWGDMRLVDAALKMTDLSQTQDSIRKIAVLANPLITIPFTALVGQDMLTGREFKDKEPSGAASILEWVQDTLGVDLLKLEKDNEGNPLLAWQFNVLFNAAPIAGRGSSYVNNDTPSTSDQGFIGGHGNLLSLAFATPYMTPEDAKPGKSERNDLAWMKMVAVRGYERSTYLSHLQDREEGESWKKAKEKEFDAQTKQWLIDKQVPKFYWDLIEELGPHFFTTIEEKGEEAAAGEIDLAGMGLAAPEDDKDLLGSIGLGAPSDTTKTDKNQTTDEKFLDKAGHGKKDKSDDLLGDIGLSAQGVGAALDSNDGAAPGTADLPFDVDAVAQRLVDTMYKRASSVPGGHATREAPKGKHPAPHDNEPDMKTGDEIAFEDPKNKKAKFKLAAEVYKLRQKVRGGVVDQSGAKITGTTHGDDADRFATQLAKETGLDPAFVGSWVRQEGGDNTGDQNWINLGPHYDIPAFHDTPEKAAHVTAEFLKGGDAGVHGATASEQAILKGKNGKEQYALLQASDFGTGEFAAGINAVTVTQGKKAKGGKAMVPDAVPPRLRKDIAKWGTYLEKTLKEDGKGDVLRGMTGPVYMAHMMNMESGYNPAAESPVGAKGLAQFMPGTRATFVQEYGVDPWDPKQAAQGMAYHLDGRHGHTAGVEGYNPYYENDGGDFGDYFAADLGKNVAVSGVAGGGATPEDVAKLARLEAKGRSPAWNIFKVPKGPEGRYAYPLIRESGSKPGTPADHMSRAVGNWMSDNAVDLMTPPGTKVRAVDDAEVVEVVVRPQTPGSTIGSGSTIQLKSKDNQYSYMHLTDVDVKLGDKVKKGAVIGTTGTANGVAHLHLGEETGNPMKLLKVNEVKQKKNPLFVDLSPKGPGTSAKSNLIVATEGDTANPSNPANPGTTLRFQKKFAHALEELARKSGQPVVVNEGFRTYDRQKYLYDHPESHDGSPVAEPGHSDHEGGGAADIQLTPEQTAILPEVGLNNTAVGSEPWHVTLNEDYMSVEEAQAAGIEKMGAGDGLFTAPQSIYQKVKARLTPDQNAAVSNALGGGGGGGGGGGTGDTPAGNTPTDGESIFGGGLFTTQDAAADGAGATTTEDFGLPKAMTALIEVDVTANSAAESIEDASRKRLLALGA